MRKETGAAYHRQQSKAEKIGLMMRNDWRMGTGLLSEPLGDEPGPRRAWTPFASAVGRPSIVLTHSKGSIWLMSMKVYN